MRVCVYVVCVHVCAMCGGRVCVMCVYTCMRVCMSVWCLCVCVCTHVSAHLVVLEEGPELLQAIQVPAGMIPQCLLLEVFKDVLPELLLQAVAVVPEETLQSVAIPSSSICHSETLELQIHLAVEVASEEEGPEAKQGIHLRGLAEAKHLPFCSSKRRS